MSTKKIHAISKGYRLACNSKIDDWLFYKSTHKLSEVTCEKCKAKSTLNLLIKH